MAHSQRLDGWLAASGVGSRSECRHLVRRSRVQVDDQVVTDTSFSVNDQQRICVNGQLITPPRRSALTVMLHKPVGYACSTDPRESPLIADLLPPTWQAEPLNSIGRLDRDTSGLLLLTTDGQLLHRLIHPKKKISKRYRIHYRGTLQRDATARVAAGLPLADDPKPCRPATLCCEASGQATMILHEGRYHQVRRMIAALGGEVTALHRDRLGHLDLPEDLEPGQCREVSAEELASAQIADHSRAGE